MIMDYEKKYKEALERAREWSLTKNGYYTPEELCKEIFPELAESEDERIRKEIEYIIQRYRDNCINEGSHRFDDCLAWLEKQGKQEIKEKPIWKHWKDGIAGNGEGKQIYLIKSGDSYTLSSCIGYECDYIELSELNRLLEKQGKQKPVEWSEEDEEKFKVVNTSCERCGNGYLTYWLNSLKERMKGG